MCVDNHISKILVVDDRPENLFAMGNILKKENAELIKVTSGNEALKQSLNYDLALILLDVQMPDMNGYEVAEFLRREEKTRHIPIIFITAIDREESREVQGYDSGAVDYIFKPVNPQILLGKVRIFIQLYENKIQLQKFVLDLEKKNEILEKEIARRKKMEIEKEKMNKEFMMVSHQAGKAEVATGILHNVGNVLNSINVSAAVVSENIRKSKVLDLSRAAKILQKQTGRMAEFLTEDDQGKNFIPYLFQLSEHLIHEQEDVVKELGAISKNIDHIKEIVNMQQSYAGISGVTEVMSIQDVLEDSIRMSRASFEKHKITLERNYGETPSITIDRHKVMQIFVNVLSNAKHALNHINDRKRILILSISSSGTHVRVLIRDNGMGIKKENLTKIFSHGFTTKKNGHGFGLHSSALTAKEIGGALSVESEGEGKGASFVLDIPIF